MKAVILVGMVMMIGGLSKTATAKPGDCRTLRNGNKVCHASPTTANNATPGEANTANRNYCVVGNGGGLVCGRVGDGRLRPRLRYK